MGGKWNYANTQRKQWEMDEIKVLEEKMRAALLDKTNHGYYEV